LRDRQPLRNEGDSTKISKVARALQTSGKADVVRSAIATISLVSLQDWLLQQQLSKTIGN